MTEICLVGQTRVPLLARTYACEPTLKINGRFSQTCDAHGRSAGVGRPLGVGTRHGVGSPLVPCPQYLPPSPKALPTLFTPPHTIISLPDQTAV